MSQAKELIRRKVCIRRLTQAHAEPSQGRVEAHGGEALVLQVRLWQVHAAIRQDEQALCAQPMWVASALTLGWKKSLPGS